MVLIILNGPSSSGKTTLAKALQSTLTELAIYISLDHFILMFPDRITCDHDRLVEELDNHILNFNRSLPIICSGFQCCIVDYVFERREWFVDLRDVLNNKRSVWIGLYCDASELTRREHLRGDRRIGLGVSQMNVVHHDIDYDLRLDTSAARLDQQVLQVMKIISSKM